MKVGDMCRKFECREDIHLDSHVIILQQVVCHTLRYVFTLISCINLFQRLYITIRETFFFNERVEDLQAKTEVIYI